MIASTHLALAFFLDLAIGDPRWLPHPVQIMGRGITGAEGLIRRYFKDGGEKAGGVLLVAVIVLPSAFVAFVIGRVLLSFSDHLLMLIGAVLFIYLVSTTLALRGLIGSARLVIGAVNDGNIADARRNLAMIVGRDTENLEEEAILRATIESLAENLSDGVVAPLLYLVVGGLPLAVAYKAINTLDSMVGYKNARYIRFGWAAARLDDVANYIPARITGLSIVAAALVCRLFSGGFFGLRAAHDSLTIMRRDGRNHTSPNSGFPEAAMAGALGVRLGGPSSYGGVIVKKPYVGDPLTDDYGSSADQAVVIATTASFLVVAVAIIVLNFGKLL